MASSKDNLVLVAELERNSVQESYYTKKNAQYYERKSDPGPRGIWYKSQD